MRRDGLPDQFVKTSVNQVYEAVDEAVRQMTEWMTRTLNNWS